jgi:hypothetical protein
MAGKSLRLRYHCVTINSGRKGCEAAKALKDIRMLSPQAPRLPLVQCSSPETCQCTYRHYDDRRAGPRRADDRGEMADPWSRTDRRRSIGRRAAD